MKGIGVDIVDLDRLDISNEKFVKRILSLHEYEVFQSLSSRRQLEFLGGRFAAKEAYMKANHVGLGGLSFQSIEILNHSDGSPYFANDPHASISISHEEKYAIAFVIKEE